MSSMIEYAAREAEIEGRERWAAIEKENREAHDRAVAHLLSSWGKQGAAKAKAEQTRAMDAELYQATQAIRAKHSDDADFTYYTPSTDPNKTVERRALSNFVRGLFGK